MIDTVYAPRLFETLWRFGLGGISMLFASFLLALSGCTSATLPGQEPGPLPDSAASSARGVEELLVVDCLLPGQVRKLGRRLTYLTPRRPIRTSAQDCEIRGGEYVAYDRSNYATALKVWLPLAQEGDKAAQTYVGEIYEKGLGIAPDYILAVAWYRKAAEQGDSRAQINLGYLYEKGLGVEKDPVQALQWYRRASGLNEAIAIDPGSINTTADQEVEELEQLKEQQVALPGPSIQLIDPPLPARGALFRGGPRDGGRATRDGVPQVKTAPEKERMIVGQVAAPAALVQFIVNGRAVQPDMNGLFRLMISVQDANVPVKLVAVDSQGKRTTIEFLLTPKTAPGNGTTPSAASAPQQRRFPDIDFGNYYALIVGNRDYAHWDNLETPENDARQTAQMLTEKYGFTTQVLLNATRRDILQALNELRKTLTEKDNLLIYYAGHGHLDETIARGYWVPTDGELDSPVDWIATFAITDFLGAMSAKHVLVVADSCYSGALTRSALARLEAGMSEEARQHWLQVTSQKRSRTVLSSGDLQPVLDIGGGDHSVFAKAFLDVLNENGDVLAGQQLYRHVSARVTYAADALAVEQIPQYAPVRFAGHESGDFLFVPIAP